MRFHVNGSSESAKATRGLLAMADIAVVDTPPMFGITVTLDVNAGPDLIVDAVDSEFERKVVNNIAELTSSDIVLRRGGGLIHGEREMLILVPEDDAIKNAVETGILRAALQTCAPRKRWWLGGRL